MLGVAGRAFRGKDGLLYPIGNIDALVAHLERLIEVGDVRRALITSAMERMRDFTARECAARTASLLREIVASRSRQPLLARSRYTALPASDLV